MESAQQRGDAATAGIGKDEVRGRGAAPDDPRPPAAAPISNASATRCWPSGSNAACASSTTPRLRSPNRVRR